MTLRLQRALMDGAILQAKSQNSSVYALITIEDALDLTIQLEEIVLPEIDLLVLNLQRLLNTFL